MSTCIYVLHLTRHVGKILSTVFDEQQWSTGYESIFESNVVPISLFQVPDSNYLKPKIDTQNILSFGIKSTSSSLLSHRILFKYLNRLQNLQCQFRTRTLGQVYGIDLLLNFLTALVLYRGNFERLDCISIFINYKLTFPR